MTLPSREALEAAYQHLGQVSKMLEAAYAIDFPTPPEALREERLRDTLHFIVRRIEHYQGQTFSNLQVAGQSLDNLHAIVLEKAKAALLRETP